MISSNRKHKHLSAFLLEFQILIFGLALTWITTGAQALSTKESTPILLVHGGAGSIPESKYPGVKRGVKNAARAGYETLLETSNVLDAVMEAVNNMELNPLFNAGYGSALTFEGKVEMDAAIMNGADLNAGCVSIAKNIYHPITLARRVMEKTPHKYLAGEGLMAFAKDQGFEILPERQLITEASLEALEKYKQCANEGNCLDRYFGSPGTVGAVAIDKFGNVAVATSTGGTTGKMPGRIGDSPILGGGTYADNTSGAISATGHGETFMRFNVASRILALIQYHGRSAQNATQQVLEDMTGRFGETGGVISIDSNGEVGIYFTSKTMSWAYQRGNELHFGVEKNEDLVEIVTEPQTTFW